MIRARLVTRKPDLGRCVSSSYNTLTHNAIQGRFRQIDPMPGQDGITDTAYSYAGNDPVNRVDPDGRLSKQVDDAPGHYKFVRLCVVQGYMTKSRDQLLDNEYPQAKFRFGCGFADAGGNTRKTYRSRASFDIYIERKRTSDNSILSTERKRFRRTTNQRNYLANGGLLWSKWVYQNSQTGACRSDDGDENVEFTFRMKRTRVYVTKTELAPSSGKRFLAKSRGSAPGGNVAQFKC